MISFREFLEEARRNADHPAQQKKSPVEQLEQYSGRRDIFVTYTMKDKVGINPRSKYPYEPLGIYTYPLDVIMDDLRSGGIENVPFGADTSKYLFVLNLKSNNALEVERYSYSDFKRDLAALEKKFPQDVYEAMYFFNNGTASPDIDPKAYPIWKSANVSDSWYNKMYTAFNTKGKTYPFIKLSFLIRSISTFRVARRIQGEKGSNAFISSVYRKVLGYDVLIDRNPSIGLIHPAEPQQAVFLTPKAYNVVDKIYTKPPK